MNEWQWRVLLIIISSVFVVLLTAIKLIYGTQCIIDAFHRRRVRVYFGATHPHRHRYNRTKVIASIESSTDANNTHTATTTTATSTTMVPLRLPGVNEVYMYDGRNVLNEPRVRDDGGIRIVSWNIELGYNLNDIVKRLRTLMPIDILLLQEVDIVTDVPSNLTDATAAYLAVDCVKTIAHELNMMAAFTGSFAYKFGAEGQGIWGSAVLSPWPISDARPIITPTLIANYPKPTTAAVITHPSLGKVLCYSVHLEACSGIVGRIQQFSHILSDWYQQHRLISPSCVVFAGDFNTLGQGMARISPVHCRDALRWRTLFEPEPQWWHRRLFSSVGQAAYGFSDPFDKCSKSHYTLINDLSQSKYDWILTNGATAYNHDVGNTTESDHWWVMCDVRPSPYTPPPPQMDACLSPTSSSTSSSSLPLCDLNAHTLHHLPSGKRSKQR